MQPQGQTCKTGLGSTDCCPGILHRAARGIPLLLQPLRLPAVVIAVGGEDGEFIGRVLAACCDAEGVGVLK